MADVTELDRAVQTFFDHWARSRHRAYAVQMTIACESQDGGTVLEICDAGDVDRLLSALGGAFYGAEKDARDSAGVGEGLPEQARKPR